MKKTILISVFALGLFACDSQKSEEPQAQPSEEAAAKTESDSEEEESPEQDFDALEEKSCKEFYAYSREICLQALRDGLDRSCYKIFVQANSSRKKMAGEGSQKMFENLSDEQKVEVLCGRPYSKLAEQVSEASTEKPDLPAGCSEAIDMIDAECLKPIAAGKEPRYGCGVSLQSVSRWQGGERFCQLTKDHLMN